MSGFPVKNITECVHRDDRTDLQRAQLNGIAPDPGFHAEVHSLTFAHRRAAARTVVPVPIVRSFQGSLRSFKSHRSVRTGKCVSHCQIKKIRLHHKRHFGHADIKPDTALLQIRHNAVRRAQAKSTASGKNDRMDNLCAGKRFQQFAFPGSGTAAPDIKPGPHSFFTNENRAARAPGSILRLADFYSDLCDRYLPHFHNPCILSNNSIHKLYTEKQDPLFLFLPFFAQFFPDCT